jgi:hypothetical protein
VNTSAGPFVDVPGGIFCMVSLLKGG